MNNDQTPTIPDKRPTPTIAQHIRCWLIASAGIILYEIADTAQSAVQHAIDSGKIGLAANAAAQPNLLVVALHEIFPGALLGVLLALKVAGVILIGPMMRIVGQFLGNGAIFASQVFGRTAGALTANFRTAAKPEHPE